MGPALFEVLNIQACFFEENEKNEENYAICTDPNDGLPDSGPGS